MSDDCNVNGNIKSTVKFRGHNDSEFHLSCEFYYFMMLVICNSFGLNAEC